MRTLIINWNPTNLNKKIQFQAKIKKNKIQLEQRNLKIKYVKTENKPVKTTLIGYDGMIKYQKTGFPTLQKIFSLIDQMPIRKLEMCGGNMDLYSDNNPKTTLKGTGFKDAKKARDTIKLVKEYSKVYQFQVINTMYYRAKYHPHRTKGMEEAMKIFSRWLAKYKKSKRSKV